jgi:O-acetyl-ADP-ribose deacetylase (regulator of RNase III)
MLDIKLYLCDIDERMVAAWRHLFKQIDSVEISQGNILDLKADAIISPANSFGIMDGGIDLAYRNYFGFQIQQRLQTLLISEHDSELPVGQAVIITTDNENIPYMISAPTMRVPMDVADTANAYLAFRAAIRVIKIHNRDNSVPIRTVLSPGLCTLSGHMPHDRAARQMCIAYKNLVLGELKQEIHPARVMNEHFRLMR